MKRAILGLVLILGAGGARAIPPATPAAAAAEPKTPTKDLVAAAKEAKGKRKQPDTKVITNADVKKSKGKLIVLSSKDQPPVDAKEVDPLTPLQRHDADYRERILVDEKVREAQARVDELEKELFDIESRYYEENDPDRRDRIIREKFNETKAALDAAKSHLESLIPKKPEPET
ncbi:MAG: hypothetical protein ACXW2P_00925 [Thermoanaerobaculia bacterium]